MTDRLVQGSFDNFKMFVDEMHRSEVAELRATNEVMPLPVPSHEGRRSEDASSKKNDAAPPEVENTDDAVMVGRSWFPEVSRCFR